ncbi:hypothetical protein P3X46_016831 [Hevea brasiliensis]|uniref:RING-type E3 ubiquitin transferase n=1 Tax=Hevea brasiliensis TaxID=3981 RepID=A0ABQ9M0C8_HEVBR|nr:putative RING-H2 finger protein ATL21B [Hevea brasiliensis]KAJ9173722.1 hypothetical protein P3X46_016831 [Hevea brasiliensis]
MAVLGLFFFLFFIKISHTVQLCEDSCSPRGPEVRFPFGLDGRGCNYPGFNLSCNETGQTILNLPRSGNFIVKSIDYRNQEVRITDPGHCFAQRLLNNFSLSGSSFDTVSYKAFSFLNCSSNFSDFFVSFPSSSRRIHCLSDKNFTIVAIPTFYEGYVPQIPSCTVKAQRVNVPVYWPLSSEGDASLIWDFPDCVECELSGGNCGFKDASTLEIGCFNLPSNAHGLPRSAKYGIIIGVGIPALLCIIGLGCYLCGRIRNYSRRHQSSADVTTTFAHTPSISISGLDGPTIESYPKTLLGDSRRLPKPNDNTCPICLCEYEPKETLRTIPECNHYFHADCIDEWLKMNATCPLCRNSPDMSSVATTPSSLLSASPSSLLSASSSTLSTGR